jgi:hypothetical protein
MTVILWNIVQKHFQDICCFILLAASLVNICYYMQGPKEPFLKRLFESYKKTIVSSFQHTLFTCVACFSFPIVIDIYHYISTVNYSHIFSSSQMHLAVGLFFLTGPLLTFGLYSLGKRLFFQLKLEQLSSDEKESIEKQGYIFFIIASVSATFVINTPEALTENTLDNTLRLMLFLAVVLFLYMLSGGDDKKEEERSHDYDFR